MKRRRPVEFPLPRPQDLGRPLWRSVELAIAWQIDIGRVPAGDRIPSTRMLSRLLGVSRNTVDLAVGALVADGYLTSRVGDGTYVLPHASRTRGVLWNRPRRWVHDPDGLLFWIIRAHS